MYLSLQLCRALAALMVVCFHASGNLRRDRYLGDAADVLERVFSFGDAGVSFFFVLSGFIVTWVHLRDFNQPGRLGNYLFTRAARIYPS
jgi:peptidoglycan/LPS O-acetylase OafA/YrhL